MISDRLHKLLAPFLPPVSLQKVEFTAEFEEASPIDSGPFWELTKLPVAHIDLQKSGAKRISTCRRCGESRFNFNAGMDLVIERRTWRQWNVFSVAEFTNFWVTEDLLDRLAQNGITNYEIGRTAVIG
ncbi:MAG: hypothetical protein ABJZ55_05045 [Fuerstiella sp.]